MSATKAGVLKLRPFFSSLILTTRMCRRHTGWREVVSSVSRPLTSTLPHALTISLLVSELVGVDAQAEREVRRDTPLRRARSCYGHLAGVEGVALMDGLLELGWIEVHGEEFHAPVRLTSQGADAMARLGIDADELRNKKRKFAFACLDWTERSFHLGGSLGAEVLFTLEKRGYVKRSQDTREVVTLKRLTDWLNT